MKTLLAAIAIRLIDTAAVLVFGLDDWVLMSLRAEQRRRMCGGGR